jgi:Xaa-Pro aminopeptidase
MNYLLQRRQSLIQSYKKHSLDGFLVTNPVNVTYLTGFTGDSSFYVSTPKNGILISDPRFEEQIKQECFVLDEGKPGRQSGHYPRTIKPLKAAGKDEGLEAHIRPYTKTIYEAAAEVLTKTGAKSVGVEGSRLTLEELETLKQLAPKVTFVPVTGLIEEQRKIKDPSEIKLIREAVSVAERAYRMLIATLRVTDTEKDMVDALEGYVRRAGGRGTAFPTIVAVGERGALPHAPPTNKSLGDGSKVLIDWGADLLYKSDMTRTLRSLFGTTPTRRNKYERVGVPFEWVYNVVLQAQNAALEAIRPGVPAKEVDAAARKVLASARSKDVPHLKLVDHFTHGLGHGIGLEIHEAPRIRPNSDDILQEGMVVTIEPGVYIPGWGGVRIEDDVLVTQNGATLLTTLPREASTVGG